MLHDGTYTDATGNSNTEANQFTWTMDAVPPTVAPTMTISSSTVSNGDTSNDDSIALTFTSSEATTNFVVSDITVSGGSLSDFAATSTTVYTATFTPSSAGATTVDVGADGFTDAYGNGNTAASQFSWTYDNSSAELSNVTISSNNTTEPLAKVDDVITLTFTANEKIDTPTVTVSGGGASSNFACIKSLLFNWSLHTRQSQVIQTRIVIGAGTYTDPYGNNSCTLTIGNWTFDRQHLR